ncbi:CRM-domain containing factor CFM3A, chloroplastic/mitochondrial-like isoform X1 [Arachis hypogaea]|uniref:CRM-domain containing factor CFM3A, chloroplastic/mitochondrial-like isoform X1 n=1 Tax=Arachis hypogaea TaxID=3818 RepID=UPI003B223B73
MLGRCEYGISEQYCEVIGTSSESQDLILVHNCFAFLSTEHSEAFLYHRQNCPTQTTLQSSSLPFCFRNRNLQGLAVAILKLWEKSLVVKIAVKRGILNTNNELMAEELKKLMGGTLLIRNKYFIVMYSGKDFVPTSVATVLVERQEMTKQVVDDKEKARCRAIDVTQSGADEATTQVGSLAEFYEAQTCWGRDISAKECEKTIKESAKAKNIRLFRKVERPDQKA